MMDNAFDGVSGDIQEIFYYWIEAELPIPETQVIQGVVTESSK